ncbi:MAG: restriction endonuclease subunit S [Candidatus Gastranaerophilaceae bacterium]
MTEVIEKTEYKKGYKKTKLGWVPEDWEECCLKDITTIFGRIGFRGYTKEDIVQKNEGAISLSPTNIKNERICYDDNTYISNFKYEESPEIKIYDDDIIFVKTGSSYGKSAIIKNLPQKATINPQLIVFKDIKINRNILFNILNTNSFNRFLQKIVVAGAIPTLSQEQIYKYPITLPTKKEQAKIAEILSAWDDGIEILEKLIEQKEILHKSLMKNLLSGKKRLPQFSSKWVHSKFNNIFERITRKNEELNTNILTISAKDGLISQKDFYNKRIASVDTTKYILLNNGEYAYNKSYSSGYPLGAIKRLDLYTKGVVSSLYICFKLKGQSNCSDFWKYFFEAGMLNREIKMIAQEGARNHGLLNMATEDFFNMLLYYPEGNQEQQKIAEILNKSNEEINLLNSKLEKLKKQKKGLMQQLLTGKIRVKV